MCFRSVTFIKLKWKQYISCRKIKCGLFIMSSDCTKTSKIKDWHFLHPNSLSINTVMCSSLQLQNLVPFSFCRKRNWEKKRRKIKYNLRFYISPTTSRRNWERRNPSYKRAVHQSSVIYWNEHQSKWSDTCLCNKTKEVQSPHKVKAIF